MNDLGEADNRRALVVVPTYNEAINIHEVITRLFHSAGDTVDLLVVDDSSPDGTSEAVQSSAGFDRVHLIRRPKRMGLASAYVEGFQWGLARGYWALVEMDADLSHDPADVTRLLEALSDATLAIGSRYVTGGAIENWSPLRRLLSRAGNLYAEAWLQLAVRDSTSGFRAYRAAALLSQDLEAIRTEGYGFQIEMVRRIQRSGAPIVEVPITFIERAAGRSKMSRRIILEAVVYVTGWGLRDRLGRLRRG